MAANAPEVSPQLLDYIREALGKKYPAILIRTALKKNGYSDKIISAAFAQLREGQEQQPLAVKAPKPIAPAFPLIAIELPPPAELALSEEPELPQPFGRVPEPPKIQAVLQPLDGRAKRQRQVRHIVAAALFLIAVILLMYAALAPLLAN